MQLQQGISDEELDKICDRKSVFQVTETKLFEVVLVIVRAVAV